MKKAVLFSIMILCLIFSASCGRESRVVERGGAAGNEGESVTLSEMETTTDSGIAKSGGTTYAAQSTDGRTQAEEASVPESKTLQETAESQATKAPQAASETASATDVTAEKTTQAADPLELYKRAAARTGAIEGVQTLSLVGSISGEGTVGRLAELVTPIVKAALKQNSLEYGIIPGNYDALCAEDLEEISSASEDGGIRVRFRAKGQTCGIDSDGTSGSVGHAVGTITTVARELDKIALPVEYTYESVTMEYTNCHVYALIGENGRLKEGEWSCDVKFTFSDIKVAGITVERVSATVRSVVTF